MAVNETLFDGFGRVRTVVEGPDGALYALTSNRDGRGAARGRRPAAADLCRAGHAANDPLRARGDQVAVGGIRPEMRMSPTWAARRERLRSRAQLLHA